ncbi:Bro-N domain-containing protein [Xylophilus sp. GOD-11R]|nr:BRO family protein [Xylophilus sp. GOD-11R]WPB59362.1 BRO family protein [Xylophilus sp. GOD-11R]
MVSEAGLYALILRSRKAEAKPFQRWVTKEVLPTIRRTRGQ